MYENDSRMMDNSLYCMDLVVYGVVCVVEILVGCEAMMAESCKCSRVRFFLFCLSKWLL